MPRSSPSWPVGSAANSAAPASLPTIAPSLTHLGQYRLLRLLGAGGMSEVFLGYDAVRLRTVAVKILLPHLAEKTAFTERFRREGELICRLDHPNIIRGIDHGVDQPSGLQYLIMEHIEGLTLQQKIDQSGILSVAEATKVVLEIASGLDELHALRVVHRDVKPGNILLAVRGSAMLADFGVARQIDSSGELTNFDQGVGTPCYMSWEQSLNPGLVDARSDIFSLGVTFYQMLTGRLPYLAPTDREIAELIEKGQFTPVRYLIPNMPRAVDEILQRMICPDPRSRFSSAASLREGLTAARLSSDTFVSVPLNARSESAHMDAPTRADLTRLRVEPSASSADGIVWSLRYRREDGVWRKQKGLTSDILRWCRDGLLPDEIFACRFGEEKFRRLETFPEFAPAGPANHSLLLSAIESDSPLPGDDDSRDWAGWILSMMLLTVTVVGCAFVFLR